MSSSAPPCAGAGVLAPLTTGERRVGTGRFLAAVLGVWGTAASPLTERRDPTAFADGEISPRCRRGPSVAVQKSADRVSGCPCLSRIGPFHRAFGNSRIDLYHRRIDLFLLIRWQFGWQKIVGEGWDDGLLLATMASALDAAAVKLTVLQRRVEQLAL